MSDVTQLPPPADPVVVAQWAGQIRTLLAALAGMGLIGGVWAGVSAEQIANGMTALLTLMGVAGYAWAAIASAKAKKADRTALVAAAVASANRGEPVAVRVTPEGQPNVATPISVAEQVQAPSVPQPASPA